MRSLVFLTSEYACCPIAESVSRSRYVGQSTQDTERPDLGSARVVITGGRALKSVENFKMIEKLAEKLGGAG